VNPPGDWTMQADDPTLLCRALRAKNVGRKGAGVDREGQFSQDCTLISNADDEAGVTRARWAIHMIVQTQKVIPAALSAQEAPVTSTRDTPEHYFPTPEGSALELRGLGVARLDYLPGCTGAS